MINMFSIDSAVADATRNRFYAFRALKRTAKFKPSLRDESYDDYFSRKEIMSLSDKIKNILGMQKNKIPIRWIRTLPETMDILCANCDKVLAKYVPETDDHEPNCDELVASGNVAVPNFGWFCSQSCGIEYEKLKDLHFQRDESGKINYD